MYPWNHDWYNTCKDIYQFYERLSSIRKPEHCPKKKVINISNIGINRIIS